MHQQNISNPMTEEITKKLLLVLLCIKSKVMTIARDVGKLSWEDVSQLRKAMSKSYGEEFFDRYWQRFKVGAEENGIDEDKALKIWKNINTMGSWAFNRSHAISYGLVSYWCCVLKSKFPLEFAAACLRNVKDEEQGIRLLREVVNEGLKYKPFDRFKSETNWSCARWRTYWWIDRNKRHWTKNGRRHNEQKRKQPTSNSKAGSSFKRGRNTIRRYI